VNRLFYAPGACSIGIHVLLEEIGLPYAAEPVNLREPAAHRPLTALNPKSRVPALLRQDGSVLTEFSAIAVWLAGTHPAAALLPGEADHEAVKARGREIVAKGFSILDHALAGREYVTGRFSIADAALFNVGFWAADRLGIALPPACAAHLARLKARPAVAAVLRKEGFA
jgi:glutathione S-transferase